jgi:hypothetical protein
MARKTTASMSGDRRKRLAAPQMDLFARRPVDGAPSWLDLPKDARQSLVDLMTRLILEHVRTKTMGDGHDH